MSTEANTTQNNVPEIIEVKGSKLIKTINDISAQGEISRLIIYYENGDKLLNIPYAAGLAVTALAAIYTPIIAVLTPFVLLMGRFKIEIIRPESKQSAQEAPPPPAEKAQAKAAEMLEEISTSVTEQAEATSTDSEAEVESNPVIPQTQPEPDNLEEIKGIGEVFAGRLHDAGIHSFAQLAELPPEQLSEIVSPEKTEQMLEVKPWIAEARELSQENS